MAKYNGYLPQWYNDKDQYSDIAESIAKEIDRSICDNIIISSEEFYRLACNKAATVQLATKDLCELFSDHQVKVVMYVREPFQFAKSWYNQANKANVPTRRFSDFFYYLNNTLLSPQANAALWRSCFGTESLILEPYELSGAAHINRFLEIIGVNNSLTMCLSNSLVNKKRNESTLELDRLSRIMLLDSENEQNRYLDSIVFKNPKNTKLLQDKVDTINSEFSRFCHVEGLNFQNSPFTLIEVKSYEKVVNGEDNLSPSLLRRKLTQLRNSRLAHIAKKTL